MEAGKSGYGPGPAARKAQLVTLARCMRAHGLRTLPDSPPVCDRVPV